MTSSVYLQSRALAWLDSFYIGGEAWSVCYTGGAQKLILKSLSTT